MHGVMLGCICLLNDEVFLGICGPGVDVRYEALLSCMRRLSSLGVMAMSIPTNCVVGVNRFWLSPTFTV